MYDMVIKGGWVIPGDGPGYPADIAVQGTIIAAVAPNLSANLASSMVDAHGLWICPGFIDMHAHSALRSFTHPLLEPKIAQGFTTEVIHPDGLAPAPVKPSQREARHRYLRPLEGPGPDSWTWETLPQFLETLDATHPTTTLVPSVGHNAVREYVMGNTNREPTPRELQAMADEVEREIEAGARMLSFGLIYLPGVYAQTEELIALARVAARHAVPLMPHIRNEGEGILSALTEMIDVARLSGASLHLSHLKLVGSSNLLDALLTLLDKASRDIDLTFDQYPYGAGSTLLTAILPPWALDGGVASILTRLRDPHMRSRIRHDIVEGIPGWENLYRACGPSHITIADAPSSHAIILGHSLRELGLKRNQDPLDAVLDLLEESALDVAMIDHYATDEVVKAIFRHPLALVGTDGIFGAHPHPRLYGTAAKVLGQYALRDHLISPEDAVARLTSRAADRLHLKDRGRILKGLRADLVLLDPKKYTNKATFAKPRQYPSGIEMVFIAGQPVWAHNAPTEIRPGGVLGF